ncbi:unnamed protein product [Adineta steineri]|uniref:Uncharacterized protein n=1 Tax=Adineta steineri TaxID=433720 RepID=A0A814F5C7_9BILA|nr:unnamed protein product [Adineta steineri]CAF3480855.1 unnamed protein product [Adineta steineri]
MTSVCCHIRSFTTGHVRENQQLKFHVEQLENDKHTLESEIEALKIELNILQKNDIEIKAELQDTQHDLALIKRQSEEETKQKQTQEKINLAKLL